MEGGGQVEPSAYRIERFTRMSLFTSLSPLGPAIHMSTNLSPHLDVRMFGAYFFVNHEYTRSGFNVALNVGFANVGSFADIYLFRKPFRISPGFLWYNSDRVRGEFKAQPSAIFTINNVEWHSDNADPVHGLGRLNLGGSGFLLTGGYGRILSRSERHFSFPFEAGVAFINTPKATLNLEGQICNASGTNCELAINYPGFADALSSQLATWNRRFAPYHVYPIVEGGVAYTFQIRRRSE